MARQEREDIGFGCRFQVRCGSGARDRHSGSSVGSAFGLANKQRDASSCCESECMFRLRVYANGSGVLLVARWRVRLPRWSGDVLRPNPQPNLYMPQLKPEHCLKNGSYSIAAKSPIVSKKIVQIHERLRRSARPWVGGCRAPREKERRSNQRRADMSANRLASNSVTDEPSVLGICASMARRATKPARHPKNRYRCRFRLMREAFRAKGYCTEERHICKTPKP